VETNRRISALTIPVMWAKMIAALPSIPIHWAQLFVFNRGPVAQLGARFHGMEEVAGSIPARSTNLLNQLDKPESWGACIRSTPQRTSASALSLVRLPAATRHTPGKTALSTL
jgi:hypothetical protein